jgi:hypothetical protein
MSKASITASTGSERELKNPTDAQASPYGDFHYQSTILDLKTAMPRKTGLLHMLKMSSLRRSAGTHPLRVEVKDEQQPKDMKSSSKSTSSRSSIVTNVKQSSIGSSNGSSHPNTMDYMFQKYRSLWNCSDPRAPCPFVYLNYNTEAGFLQF